MTKMTSTNDTPHKQTLHAGPVQCVRGQLLLLRTVDIVVIISSIISIIISSSSSTRNKLESN
jgi:hypothetical protein